MFTNHTGSSKHTNYQKYIHKKNFFFLIPLELGSAPQIPPPPHLCMTAKNYNLGEFQRTLITRDAFIIFTLEMSHKPLHSLYKTLSKLNMFVATGGHSRAGFFSLVGGNG